MRKNVLALSIATMIGGLTLAGAASAAVIVGAVDISGSGIGIQTASALQLAPGGVGHILVVPYFTAQGGNATILSLVNTDVTNGKALKVRFRGASNSDDVLDFTLLMSPGDVWNALVDASSPTSLAQLTTTDNTCTYPRLVKGVPRSFDASRIDPTLSADLINSNTREGYIEIFNMADIPPKTSIIPGISTTNSTLYTTIKHSSAGVATCDDAVLEANLLSDVVSTATATAERVAYNRGLAAPTTGIMGNWTIINVPQTTTFSGSATAVRALSSIAGPGADGVANFVLFPQSPGQVTNPDIFTADPSLRALESNVFTSKTSDALVASGSVKASGGTVVPVITAAFYDLPDLSTPYISTAGLTTAITGASVSNEVGPRAQAALLTAALAVNTITNEYTNEPSVQAKTDWVFSLPTRRYSIALTYGSTASRVYSDVPTLLGTQQYFFSSNTAVTNRQICVNSDSQGFYDREEGKVSGGAVFSPGQVSNARFCGETSVLSFNSPIGTASVLSASVARQDTGASAKVNGWGVVGTANGGPGLPLLGGSFIKLVNPLASAGTSGTYGLQFDHRFKKVN